MDQETVDLALKVLARRKLRPLCPRCGRGETQTREGFCTPCTEQHKAALTRRKETK